MNFLKSLTSRGYLAIALLLGLIAIPAVLEISDKLDYKPVIEKAPYEKVDMGPDEISSEDEDISVKDELPVIVLNKKNTIVFDDVVTTQSVAILQVELLKIANTAPKDTTIYLVLNTPGGSISAGMQLIDTIKAMPQKIKTITVFAASMGFIFVQNLEERLIIPSGILMSHRASVKGLSGEIGGELDTKLNTIKRRVKYLEIIVAKRMGLTLKEYRSKIADELWLQGFDSVEQKAADRMVLARCSSNFSGTKVKYVRTPFGNAKLIMSECPLISGPLGVSFRGIEESKRAIVRKFFKERYENPKLFIDNYIKNGEFLNILKN